MFEFVGIFAETCEKIDVCSRRKSNGEVISLRDVAGGAKGPVWVNYTGAHNENIVQNHLNIALLNVS